MLKLSEYQDKDKFLNLAADLDNDLEKQDVSELIPIFLNSVK